MSTGEDRVHVLQIIAGLAIGEPLGGAELFGAELVRHFDQAECRPILCAFWRRGGEAEEHWRRRLTSAGIKTFFAAHYGRQFSFVNFLKGVRRTAAHLKPFRVDVIHSHFQVGSIAAILLQRKLGARAILRTDHIALEWGPTVPGFVCRQIFTKWVFPLVFDSEAAVSRAIGRQLDSRPGARLVEKQSVFVPNGIALDRFADVAEFSAEKLKQLGVPLRRTIIGSVGRLTGQKGYRYLLDALPTVLAARPDTSIIVVGDGELREDLHDQAKHLGLEEHVHFLGSRQDVESLLRIMDLFVLPSLWEGLPTVIMEAMASGVPVIATDISGTRELIKPGRTGWLTEPGNPKDLAAAILEALDNPLKRRRIAKNALEDVVPLYSMQAIAERYAELYHQLLR
jgi:glycosyltransferase involved in cell wall biosynthesis